MAHRTYNPKLYFREDFKITEVEKTAFFGLIRWKQTVKIDSLGTSFHIFDPQHNIKDLYINGKKLQVREIK